MAVNRAERGLRGPGSTGPLLSLPAVGLAILPDSGGIFYALAGVQRLRAVRAGDVYLATDPEILFQGMPGSSRAGREKLPGGRVGQTL